MSANSGPGYRSILTIASSRDPARGKRLSTVYYVPRKNAKMERLTRTIHRTYCPFKGDASYFMLSSGGRTENNACRCRDGV